MPITGEGEREKKKEEREDSEEEADGKWQCISTATSWRGHLLAHLFLPSMHNFISKASIFGMLTRPMNTNLNSDIGYS